jgi:acyl-ACP thioesterase
MKYKHAITVPYQDVDTSRRLRIYAMENYLLNVAGKVADTMGIGIPALLPMNYTWIITHVNMEMLYLPRHGEELVFETWIERNAHMLSVRDFRIYNKVQGNDNNELQLIGCAKIVWAVLDLTSREIVNVFQLPIFEGSVDGEVLNIARAPRFKPILLDDLENEEAQTGEILHQIQYSDMDYNGHCNSCKYLEWMVNAVQAFDNQKPFRLDINYVKELYQGDIMYTRFLKTNQAVQYQQVDENGMTCCNAMISQIEKISCC